MICMTERDRPQMDNFHQESFHSVDVDLWSADGAYFAAATAKMVDDLEHMIADVKGLSQMHSRICVNVASKIGAAALAEIEQECFHAPGSLSFSKCTGAPSPPASATRQMTTSSTETSGRFGVAAMAECEQAPSSFPFSKGTWAPCPPVAAVLPMTTPRNEANGPKQESPKIPQQPVKPTSDEPEFPQSDLELSPKTVIAKSKLPSLHNAWTDIDEQTLVHYLDSIGRGSPSALTKQVRPSALPEMTSSKLSNLSLGKLLFNRRQPTDGASLSLTGMSSAVTSTYSVTDSICRWIISPYSTQRLVWDVTSILFIFDDVFMVPLQVFGIPDWTAIQVARYISRLFWAADMFMSFRTAFFDGLLLEDDPSKVARHYVRTVFGLDLSLVIIQWLQLFRSSHVIFDTIQVFRLLRLGRLSQLKKIVIERSNSNHIHLYLDVCRVAVFVLFAMHMLASGWYWIGDYVDNSGGWIHDEHMQGADIWYSYSFALRWTIAQLSGRTDLVFRTTMEYFYTCCTCVFGLIIMSLLISTITNTMIELTALDRERLTQIYTLNAYLEKKRVTQMTAIDAKKGLLAEQKAHINLERDRDVLRVLPREVRADVLYEIHEPLLNRHQLFHDLNIEFDRMMRSICAEVVKEVIAHEQETIFATGDYCTRIHFLGSGLLAYQWKKRTLRAQTARAERPSEFTKSPTSPEAPVLGQKVLPKRWVSEAALWVEWENQGELKAIASSSLATLEANEFISVVKNFQDARARSVLYARAFSSNLAKTEKRSDLLEPIRFYLPQDGQVVIQSMELEGTTQSLSILGIS